MAKFTLYSCRPPWTLYEIETKKIYYSFRVVSKYWQSQKYWF